jgi:hypothetical protein
MEENMVMTMMGENGGDIGGVGIDGVFTDVDNNDIDWSTTSNTHNDRLLATASELYDQVTFNTNAFFNEPAPEYWVSFIIGGVSTS